MGLQLLDLTRLLGANRAPLRLKTLCRLKSGFGVENPGSPVDCRHAGFRWFAGFRNSLHRPGMIQPLLPPLPFFPESS